jgi:hypothetical protein
MGKSFSGWNYSVCEYWGMSFGEELGFKEVKKNKILCFRRPLKTFVLILAL